MPEEKRVERDGLSKGHSKDALDKNLAEGSGIAADSFSGFETDEADTDGCAKTAEAALDASCDFSDREDHFIYWVVGWSPVAHALRMVPAEKGQWAPAVPLSAGAWCSS